MLIVLQLSVEEIVQAFLLIELQENVFQIVQELKDCMLIQQHKLVFLFVLLAGTVRLRHGHVKVHVQMLVQVIYYKFRGNVYLSALPLILLYSVKDYVLRTVV